MRGVNHIVVNTCSAVLGTECLISLKNISNTEIFDVKKTYNTIINFLTPNTDNILTMCLWWIGAIILFYLGTLLPDCDNRASILGRFVYIPVEHRTWTHTIWQPLIIFIISMWIPISFYLGAGYLLHLLWDNISVGGVCFCYPLSKYRHYGTNGAKIKKRHWFKLYRTGGISEYVIVIVSIVVTIVVTICMFVV